jgi:predicted XRE-type DNA-binding protein
MTKPTHVTHGDVLDDLGFPKSETAAMKIKATILDAILAEVDRRSLSQKELVVLLDEYQSNVSNLLRGRIAQISIERLLRYANRLGLEGVFEMRPMGKPSLKASRPRIASQAALAQV